jgi:hypothetical protein
VELGYDVVISNSGGAVGKELKDNLAKARRTV